MVQFKEKKKKSYNKKNKNEKTTIDSKHNKMLENFDNEIKNIPNKKIELKKIINELEQYNNISMFDLSDDKINTKLELEDKKTELENEINKIETKSELNNYLLDTSHLLYQYFDEDNNFTNTSTTNSSNKKSGCRNYILLSRYPISCRGVTICRSIGYCSYIPKYDL